MSSKLRTDGKIYQHCFGQRSKCLSSRIARNQDKHKEIGLVLKKYNSYSLTEVNFEEAVQRFAEFISDQGMSHDIAWILPKNTIMGYKIWYINEKVVENDRYKEIKSLYAKATEKTFGLNLAVRSADKTRCYCYAFVPKEQIDCEYTLMGNGLKFSIPTEVPKAIVVKQGIYWWWLRLREYKYLKWKNNIFQ